jgi:hypothetical protein
LLLVIISLLIARQAGASHGGVEIVKRVKTINVSGKGADRRLIRRGSKDKRGASSGFQHARNLAKRRADVAPEIDCMDAERLVK